MSPPSPEWESFARTLVADLAGEFGGNVEESRFTERLLNFEIVPPNPRATGIGVLVSPGEVVVFAGEGSRFELPALPGGSTEVDAVARAIAKGRLSELLQGRRIQGTLVLEDGRVLQSDVWGAQQRPVKKRTLQYEPFGLSEP